MQVYTGLLKHFTDSNVLLYMSLNFRNVLKLNQQMKNDKPRMKSKIHIHSIFKFFIYYYIQLGIVNNMRPEAKLKK